MYQADKNLKYQVDSLKEEITTKLFAKAHSLVDKILSCPRIKLSKWQTLKLVGVKTGVLLSHFAQQLRRKNTDVLDIHSLLLDPAGIYASLVLNQKTGNKNRGSWVPFKV